MAGVAADIVLRDLDAAFADRRGAQEVDREPPEMGGGLAAAPSRSTARQISADGGPACWWSGCQGPRVSGLAR